MADLNDGGCYGNEGAFWICHLKDNCKGVNSHYVFVYIGDPNFPFLVLISKLQNSFVIKSIWKY